MIMGHPGSPSRLSASGAVAVIAAEKRLRSWFLGNGVNVAKNVPETAVKLAANDALQRAWLGRGGGGDGDPDAPPRHLGVAARLAAGSAAGGLAQALIYPLEVVQTRLAASASGTYAGALHCARSIWVREGAAAFGRGLVPTLVGLVPYAGVDICAFELLRDALTPESPAGGPHAPPPAAALLAAGVASSTAAQIAAYPLGFVRVRLQMDGQGGAPRR
jgi:solute carrier family 25 phosphate transporter 23/24/25/41